MPGRQDGDHEGIPRRCLQGDGSEAEVAVACLDSPCLSRTPETFAVQYPGYVLYWPTGDDAGRVEDYLDPAVQITAVGRLVVGLMERFARVAKELVGGPKRAFV